MADSKPSEPGNIVEVLPKSMFAVKLTTGERVTAHVAGNLRSLMTRILEGDQVWVERSPYHPGRGRIVDHRPANPE